MSRRNLGATLVDGGWQFRLYAPRASRVELVTLQHPAVEASHEMTRDDDGVWSVTVPVAHAMPAIRYGYRLHGEWDPHTGRRFNPHKLMVDPYARAITDGIDYRGPISDHVPGDLLQMDTTDSRGFVPYSLTVPPTPPPTPIAQRRSLTDSVIYELHVRGFTKLHPLVPEHMRGTYAGLAYPAVVEYLADLGVTAVELLPVHHFTSEPFVALKGLRNYWGYNTLGFFAPHAGYSKAGGYLGQQVDDFKAMVSVLHEAGIEVILDVVYNHTAEGGVDGPALSLRGIDHSGYYRLAGNQIEDYDVTGCGNSLNTAHEMTRELITDSLHYWVQEMGVDGFRFDLATTLIRDAQHHVDPNHPFLTELRSDPVLEDIKLIMEPWDVGPFGYQVGAWGPGIAEWNDRYRDHVRDFWRGAAGGVQEFATRLAGSPDIFDSPGRGPEATVNFVTAHDGFTLHDAVSYDVKHNEANGESNRDGSDNNRSWNHGWEGPTDDPDINALRRRQALNFFATLMLSLGPPMITAGDEFGRTQRGNNNAYCQDSPISWVDWNIDEAWQPVRSRVKDLLALRAANPLLRSANFRYYDEVVDTQDKPTGRRNLTWINQHGTEMGEPDWHDEHRAFLGMYHSDANQALLTWFNASPEALDVTLPEAVWGTSYEVLWHSAEDHEMPQLTFQPEASFTMPPRSVVVMKPLVRTLAGLDLEA